MKKQMKFKMRKILFEEFLKKEGIIRKFKKELKNNNKDYDEFLKRNSLPSYMDAGFVWEETNDRHYFWSKLNRKWLQFSVGNTLKK